MNILFHTLGCKVNQYETQAIIEMFIKKGYTCIEDMPADITLINSCSVTAESDRKTRQLLRKCKKENPDTVIILTGCMVQAFPEISKELPEADIVIGNKDFKNIVTLTENYFKTKQKQFEYTSHKNGDKYNTPSISGFEERTRAYMKIEDGCDRFCSYCIIPYSRGRVRSRSLDDIKAEAERLSKNGFCEIVLVGINLSAYGKGEDFNICDAVEVVCSIDGIRRVRLGSIEPDHITDEMLKRFKSQPKFCPQFHLSLQSGCNETLKRMNRKYTAEFYKDLTDRIKNVFENSAITTDVMVGFSGETDEEFNESLEFVKSIGFARTHIFPYSVRPGTLAEKFGDRITNAEKTERARKMKEIADISEYAFLKKHIGFTLPVLFESPEYGFAVGYTENYIRIKVKSDTSFIGQIKNVKIVDSFLNYCIGEFV